MADEKVVPFTSRNPIHNYPQDSNAELEEAVGEEDYSGQYTPVVQLKEVKTVTSDEGEEIVWEK